MVYGGRPSLGCYLCRKRRIKCDESRPTCRNCAKYRRQCPGYRENALFRDETRKVEEFMNRAGSVSRDNNGNYSYSHDAIAEASPAAATMTTTTTTTTTRRGDYNYNRDGYPQGPLPVQTSQGYGNNESGSSCVVSSVPGNIVRTRGTRTAAATAANPAAANARRLLPSTSTPLKLYPNLNPIWEDQAVCYFFDQFTSSNIPNACPGHMEHLPALYARSQNTPTTITGEGTGPDDGKNAAHSCLRWAVDATSLITLGNLVKSTELTVKARRRHGLALRGLRNALESRTEAAKDETLSAVLLLALFEDVTGERGGGSSSHTLGLELLMQLRGGSQFGSPEGCILFDYAYTHTLVECLVWGERPRFNSEWLHRFLDESDPVHRLMIIASEVSRILMQSSSLNSSSDKIGTTNTARVPAWVKSCKLLDQELDEWPQHLPDHWLPFFVNSQKEGEVLITHQHVWIAFIWIYYRSFRVLLQRLLLYLYREQPYLEPQHEPAIAAECVKLGKVSQNLIEDICRSIPFLMEEVDIFGRTVVDPSSSLQSSSFPSSSSSSSSPSSSSSSSSFPSSDVRPRVRGFRAHGIIKPLWHVLSSGLATPRQVQQIRSVLSMVGSQLGIKLALNLVEEFER